MSILAYSGGCAVAMLGKDCVAIATDHRFGNQAQTLDTDFKKVFRMGKHLYLGLVGLQTDILTVHDRLMFRKKLYEIRENREMQPKQFSSMVSNFLYEHRFGPYFIEPLIAGFNTKTQEPYICNMDIIGCKNEPKDFIVGGTASNQLYGMCEMLWKPDLPPDTLFEVISQALLNAFDRDAMSGWGATVYIIEKHRITTKTIKTRMD